MDDTTAAKALDDGFGIEVGYRIDGEQVSFDSHCSCVSYHTSPRPSSFEEIAKWLAVQHDDGIRDRILTRLVPARY